jgi:ornithine cyclodeaminase/alanine dehydrogenase-like protein (mu-crystallin family)
MASAHRFLYLSRQDVEAVGCSMRDVMAAVELAFAEKAAGRAIMPAKHWIAPSRRRFFSAMSSALPGVKAAGCKWQSGSPDNAARGQPYITGQYILNDIDSGLPLALMDSTWITEVRTAAATAVAARALAAGPPRVLGLLGCGVQARRHLEALMPTFPSLATVRCYDTVAEAAARFRSEMTACYPVKVVVCASAREAFAGADLVVTTGPIAPDTPRLARADWLEKGATAVTIDYDCYWGAGELSRVDQVFTDDIAQLEHSKGDGYFIGMPATLGEIAEVVAATRPGRGSASERIVCINLGIALEDVATAVGIYRRARELKIGVELPI